MTQIISLTQNGHYIAIRGSSFNSKQPIHILENSVFDDASLEVFATVYNEQTQDFDFVNISYPKDTVGNIQEITFASILTLFVEIDKEAWYVFRVKNAGASTNIKFRVFATKQNLKFINS